MIKAYYYLTKPGIIYGNAITAAAGFFYAAHRYEAHWQLLLYMLVGLSLIIASACVINNVVDKDIDSMMERTKQRAIVTGQIKKSHALIFGIFLVLAGIII